MNPHPPRESPQGHERDASFTGGTPGWEGRRVGWNSHEGVLQAIGDTRPSLYVLSSEYSCPEGKARIAKRLRPLLSELAEQL